MIENYGECRAFGLSLLLHFLLFLIAAALGLFSIAAPTGNKAPIDVVLYDAGGDTGSAGGDAAPAAAPAPAVDGVVPHLPERGADPVQERAAGMGARGWARHPLRRESALRQACALRQSRNIPRN